MTGIGHNSSGATDALITRMQELREGEIVSYDEMEQITGLHRGNATFRSMVNRARLRMQRKHGTVLRCEPNVGYKRLSDKEAHIHTTTADPLKARRHNRRWQQRVKAVVEENLSDEQRSSHRMLRNNLSTLNSLMRPAKITGFKMPKLSTRKIDPGDLSSLIKIE